jgi:hypothetical protein
MLPIKPYLILKLNLINAVMPSVVLTETVLITLSKRNTFANAMV